MQRVTMPCPWSEIPVRPPLRFRRRFGYPGRIDAHERIWLTVIGLAQPVDVLLNDRYLTRGGPGSLDLDVTTLVQERNVLEVAVDVPAGDGSPWDEVALEIRSTAYLRNVRAWQDVDDKTTALRVAGEVIGTADRPLDLYLLVGGSTIAYTAVVPSPQGQRFELQAEHDIRAGDTARVELVNGGVVWYAVDVTAQ